MFSGAVRVFARPLVKMWLSSTALSRALIPRPPGTGAVHTTGTNPARVLLVGGAAAIGFGVLSHDRSRRSPVGRWISMWWSTAR